MPKNGEQYGTGIQYVMKNGRLALEMGFSVSVRELPLAHGNMKQDPGSFFTDKARLDLLKEEEFVLWCANKWWRHDDNSNRKTENLKRIALDSRLDLIDAVIDYSVAADVNSVALGVLRRNRVGSDIEADDYRGRGSSHWKT